MSRIMQNTETQSITTTTTTTTKRCACFIMPISSTQDRLKLLYRNLRMIHEIIWSHLESLLDKQKRDKRDYISTLCEDIMIEIFRRLPVEYVWACKFVCEPWYRIISSRSFIENHLKSANDHATIVVIKSLKSRFGSCSGDKLLSSAMVIVDHQSNTTEKLEKFAKELRLDDLVICVSCNGIVFIQYKINIDSTRFMLYNPTTKELCTSKLSLKGYVLGFFVDESRNNNEYKIVTYSCNKDNMKSSYYLVGLRTKQCTYLGTSRYSPASRGVNVGSTLFWIVYPCDKEWCSPICCKYIMVFELQTERSYVIPHPGEVCIPALDDLERPRLWKMEGSLAYTKLFAVIHQIEIWVLQDLVNQSWVKVYNIDLTPGSLDLGEDYPTEVLDIFDGELLLRWSDRLYTYNMHSRNIRSTGTVTSLRHSKKNLLHFGNTLTYVKTLISPKSVLAHY